MVVTMSPYFQHPVQCNRDYDFHSRNYDSRLATKTRCGRDHGDYDTLFSTPVQCSRDYIFHSSNYDSRLAVETRHSRDHGRD